MTRVAESPLGGRSRRCARPAGLCWNWRRASSTHSGHWCPTGAGTMHAVQIGRPQRVQWTRVASVGCR
jgi:hypothetical protein